jgi:hypothetical protein
MPARELPFCACSCVCACVASNHVPCVCVAPGAQVTLCDILSSGLGGMGLVAIAASVWQVFRCSTIIFTAMFARVVFKKVVPRRRLIGCGILVVGLAMVGTATGLNHDFAVAHVTGGCPPSRRARTGHLHSHPTHTHARNPRARERAHSRARRHGVVPRGAVL